MEIAKKSIAVAVATAMIAGCASTGGGGGGGEVTATYADGSTRELTLAEFLACLVTLFLFCGQQTDPAATSSTNSGSASGSNGTNKSTTSTPSSSSSQGNTQAAAQPAPFTRWPDHRGGGGAIVQALGAAASISRSADSGEGFSIKQVGYSDGGELTVLYDDSGALRELRLYDRSFFPRADAASPAGYPAIDMAWSPSNTTQTVFANVRSEASALLANPYALDWNYQSFGVWNHPDVPTQERVFSVSYGAATPGAAVPAAGVATFSGKLAGLLVQPTALDYMVAANVGVQVDFGQRSVGLASSGTSIMRDGARAGAAPGLDLAGTMTYAPGSNTFTGTLTTAGAGMSGTSNGRFYGPAAEELGGVFVVKSPTGAAFTGAYGAKR